VSERLEIVSKAVEKEIGGLVRHVASTPIRHTFRNETLWEGIVETFDVYLNPDLKRCYGLTYCDGKVTKIATIRGTNDVNSPLMAVITFVASHVRK
jgi:hypothetical protein